MTNLNHLPLDMVKEQTPARLVGWREVVFVLVCLAAVLLPLEIKYPYYFLQDDNRDATLPWLVHNWRSLQEGEVALYNFHQYSGYPQLGTGQNGTLFPP